MPMYVTARVSDLLSHFFGNNPISAETTAEMNLLISPVPITLALPHSLQRPSNENPSMSKDPLLSSKRGSRARIEATCLGRAISYYACIDCINCMD